MQKSIVIIIEINISYYLFWYILWKLNYELKAKLLIMKRLKLFAPVLLLFLATGWGLAQNKPITTKDIKKKVEVHKSVAILPINFFKKTYDQMPDGITEEVIAEGEAEKGLVFQNKFYETVTRKYRKQAYTWMPVEETNAKLKEKGYRLDALQDVAMSDLAARLGVDAVVSGIVETPKFVLPYSRGSEKQPMGKIYGLEGSGTYIVFFIHLAGSSASAGAPGVSGSSEGDPPIWQWRIKMNGSFKNPEKMMEIVFKNYLSEKFPYKY